MNNKHGKNYHAFTIVELLIVIVIIGILAAITIISYSGFTKRANEAALKSDLSNASKKLKLYYVDHGLYPQDLDTNGCPTIPLDNNYCIKPSSGNVFDYIATSPYSDYTLTVEKGDVKYKIIGSDTIPVLVPSTPATPITAIAAITGTAQVGQILTAGAITPAGATVSYQWQIATTVGGAYANISGATNSNYTPTSGDAGKYIKVQITGTGSYQDTITSAATPVIIAALPITNIGAIIGTAQIGQTLTAGAITPAGATVAYQWQSAVAAGGPYTNLTSASTTYVLMFSDSGKYIRVVATGSGGYSGSVISSITPAVSVISGGLVTVGSQIWATTNLNAGTMVSGSTSQTNNGVIEKYCYNNDPSYCATYGGLYMWDEMMQYSTTEGIQGVCPVGFRIPTDNDWKVLEVYLGMTQAQADLYGWRGTDQALKLVIGGSSGLNLPPAGLLVGTSFVGIDTGYNYWTSTIAGTNHWRRYIGSPPTTIGKDGGVPNGGLSVRCLKN